MLTTVMEIRTKYRELLLVRNQQGQKQAGKVKSQQ